MVAAAAGVAGAKYAKDNPDQAKAGALILLVGGLFVLHQFSKKLDAFKGIGGELKGAGDAVVRGTEKTGDAVGNFFEGMFTGAETDYKIDSGLHQPKGGASQEYLSTFEGMEYEDFISSKGNTASYVPGKYRVKVASKSKGLHEHLYISEEEEYVTRYNFSTPIAIVTTADEPGGGEAAGGGIFDQAKGVYTNPILTVPFTDKTVIPSLQNIGGAIRGLFN